MAPQKPLQPMQPKKGYSEGDWAAQGICGIADSHPHLHPCPPGFRKGRTTAVSETPEPEVRDPSQGHCRLCLSVSETQTETQMPQLGSLGTTDQSAWSQELGPVDQHTTGILSRKKGRDQPITQMVLTAKAAGK